MLLLEVQLAPLLIQYNLGTYIRKNHLPLLLHIFEGQQLMKYNYGTYHSKMLCQSKCLQTLTTNRIVE